MNIVQMVTVFKALMQGPASRLDLAARTGVPPKTVGKLLNELKAQKMIYVIGYSNEVDGRNRVKMYTFGDGEDALPKSSQPQRVRSRRSYIKKVAIQAQAKIKTTFIGGKSPWQTSNLQATSSLSWTSTTSGWMPKSIHRQEERRC